MRNLRTIFLIFPGIMDFAKAIARCLKDVLAGEAADEGWAGALGCVVIILIPFF